MKTQEIVMLSNIEIFEYCRLNLKTGEMHFDKADQQELVCSGRYYRNKDVFFGLIKTPFGPQMYFLGNIYRLTPELDVKLEIKGKERLFAIEDYGIEIEYPTSVYIDFDVWSTDEDVDLFFFIWKYYKDKEFYGKYTI